MGSEAVFLYSDVFWNYQLAQILPYFFESNSPDVPKMDTHNLLTGICRSQLTARRKSTCLSVHSSRLQLQSFG